ncbi:MAG: transcription elongation factor, partial [Fibrobacteres bacterium]|nr:transcription elongation factor [Fibrobacterota bacterium]
MLIPDRHAILIQCRQNLQSRKSEYLRELDNLSDAAAAETKSSAGDKYETAREMIAQARNLVERNLSETNANLDALDRMAAAPLRDKVGFGSLVETTLGWYLVGVSLG